MIPFYTYATVFASYFSECLIFIYYSNSALEFKYNRLKSNLIIIGGYILLFLISFLRIAAINIISFTIINFIILYTVFKCTPISSAVTTVILSALMMFSELVPSAFFNITIVYDSMPIIPFMQDLAFVAFTQSTYFITITLFKQISARRKQLYKSNALIWFLILPISTCLYFNIMGEMNSDLDARHKITLLIIGFLLVASNFIVYIVGDKFIEKSIQLRNLKEIENKNEIDYKNYMLIKENYDSMKVLVHDFTKYCNNIEALLREDQTEALEQIGAIRSTIKEYCLIEYTDNKALNVLLSQKIRECNKLGIEFHVYIKDMSLSFLKATDVVAIFANLLDNAIEGCEKSKIKKIFLSVYSMNNAFLVIHIENNSDTEPIVSDGKLLTSKSEKAEHGIGMISIKKALKNYDGRLNWNYDKEKHIFNVDILISYKAYDS